MFGLGQAVRQVAGATTAVIGSASTTTVAGLAILESHATIRSSKEAHEERVKAWKRAVFTDVKETAKSLGYSSIQELDDEVNNYFK